MEKKQDAINAITPLVGDKLTAEMVIERLQELGYMQLGYGNSDVDSIVGTFLETLGTTKASRADRFAASRLARRYGAQSVNGIIKLYANLRDDEYAPVIGSVTQLEDKWVAVMSFIRKKAQKQADAEIIQT